jgi:hypothetical protein
MKKKRRQQGLALGTALAAVPPVLILASPARHTRPRPARCTATVRVWGNASTNTNLPSQFGFADLAL